MDDIKAPADEPLQDGCPSRARKGRAKDSEEVRAYCELLTKPIEWASRRGTEGRTLCEFRILTGGHWNRYLLLRERERRKNPEWTVAKVRSHVMVRHFAYQGVVEERDKFHRWWALMQPWLPDKMPEPNEVIRDARDVYFTRHTKETTQQYHDANAAEAAFNRLPNKAPMEDVMNWAQGHPRLFRLYQNPPTEDEPIDTALTVEDIENPYIGTAPCKQACRMLQHALRNHDKFGDQVLGETRKATTKGGAASTLDDLGAASDEDMEKYMGRASA